MLLALLFFATFASFTPAIATHTDVYARATFSPALSENGWARGPVSVELTCEGTTEECQLSYSLDQGDTLPYGGAFLVEGEGQHSLFTYATVGGVQTEPNPESYNVRIDDTPPALFFSTEDTECSTPGTSPWCQGSVGLFPFLFVEETGSPVTLTCFEDGVEVSCDAWTIEQDGVTNATATALDEAGNVATASIDIHVDATPPTPPSLDCAANEAGWCKEFATLTPAFDDASGILSDDCVLNDVTIACAEGEIQSEGDLGFSSSAADNAGLFATDGAELQVDVTPPALNLSTICSASKVGDWCTGPVEYTLSASDEGSGIADASPACTLDETSVLCEGNVTTGGVHALAITAFDVADNANTSNVTVALDLDPPNVFLNITCGTPGTSPWCRGGLAVDADAQDNESTPDITCSLDEEPAGDCNDLLGALPDGGHTLFATATDEAGRTASTTATYFYDDVAPDVAITLTCPTPGASGYCLTSFVYNMTALGGASGIATEGIACTLDGATSPCHGTVSTQGSHTVRINATDGAGNTNQTEASLAIDSIAPFVLSPIRRILPGEDDNLAHIRFQFSEPMSRAATEAALIGAVGWTLAWSDDSTWLNLTLASGVEGATMSVTVGASATDAHGRAMGSSVMRSTQVRGPRDYAVTSIPYDFVNITQTGNDTGIYCDDCGVGAELPFGFTYFGHTYYELNVSSNGFLTFGTNDCIGDWTPDPFPGTCHNLLAAYWEDLDVRLGSPGPSPAYPDRILTQTIGEAPDRVFIVTWSVVHHYPTVLPLATFQIKLFETSNVIELHYENATSDAGDHMIGLISANGTRHTTHAFAPITLREAGLRFSGSGTQGDITPPTVSVTGDQGLISGANATIVYTFSEPMDTGETLLALTGANDWLRAWNANDTVLTISHANVSFGFTNITLTTRAADANGVRIVAPVTRSVERQAPDTTAPTITPHADEVHEASSAAGAIVSYTAPNWTDDSGASGVADCAPGSGSTLALGNTTVTCTASDGAGNAANSTFRVRVVDTSAPVIDEVADIVAEATGPSGAHVAFEAPATSDAVDGEGVAQCAAGSGDVFALGVTNVMCAATDSAGNEATSSFNVTVVDTTAPTIDATEDLTIEASGPVTVAYVAPATHDAVDGAGAAVCSPASNATFPFGDTLVTCEATDAAGNEATPTTFTVRVQDTTPPTVVVSGSEGILPDASAAFRFTFSEPMNTTATLAAIENATGWNATWNENATVLNLTNGSIALGKTTLTITTDARDLHGVRLQESVSRTVERPHPAPAPELPAEEPGPPGSPTGLMAILDGTTVTLAWGPPSQLNGGRLLGYAVSVDGGEPATVAGGTYRVTGLARGATHAFRVAAVTDLGTGDSSLTTVNMAPVSTLDVQPPAASNGWHRTLPVATLRADPATATILYDLGAGERTYTGPITIPSGDITLRWRAQAGGIDEIPHEEGFRVDPHAPVISSASSRGGASLAIDATVTDTGSGIESVHAIVSGAGSPLTVTLARGAGGSYHGEATPGLGTYSITIVARDVAGNEASANAGNANVGPIADETPDPDPSGDAPRPTGDGGIPLEGTSTGQQGAPSSSGDEPGNEPETESRREPQIVIETGDDTTIDIDAGARGTIRVRLEGVDDLDRVRVVAIDENGGLMELSSGEIETTWDTTEVSDGYYTLEARRRSTGPVPGQLSIQSTHEVTLASARVLVRNPVAPPVEVAAIVVGSVLVTATAHAGLSAAAAGASSASSGVAGAGGGIDPLGFVQEVAIDAGQDKLRDKTRERDRQRRVRSLVAATGALIILAGLWAFSETEGWSLRAWMVALPIVGTAAVIVMAMKYSSESALAYATAARPRVRVWLAGAISLAISSIIFRNPFGYPAYVDETEESEDRKTWAMQGQRGIATIAGGAAFMLPFLALAPFVSWQFTSIGLLIAATNAATTAMPFGPLPGKDVWRWKKWLAIALAVGGLAIYVGFAAALAPMWSLWLVALTGAVYYAVALVRFRRKLVTPRRVPVSVPIPVRTDHPAAQDAEAPDAHAHGGSAEHKRRRSKRKR